MACLLTSTNRALFIQTMREKIRSGGGLKAAFFDIDGTLVNSHGQISQCVREQLKSLEAQGVLICLASGRPLFAAERIIEELGITGPSMFFSGALIVNPREGTLLYEQSLTTEEVTELCALFAVERLHVELYTRHECYIEARTQFSPIHEFYLGRTMVEHPFVEVLAHHAPLKFVLMAEKGEEEHRLRGLVSTLSHFSTGIAEGASHPHVMFANIASRNASREGAFAFLMKRLGIAPEQVASFGDGEADIPFIKLSGLGFAMGNSNELVKKSADYVLGTVDKGGLEIGLEVVLEALNGGAI